MSNIVTIFILREDCNLDKILYTHIKTGTTESPCRCATAIRAYLVRVRALVRKIQIPNVPVDKPLRENS